MEVFFCGKLTIKKKNTVQKETWEKIIGVWVRLITKNSPIKIVKDFIKTVPSVMDDLTKQVLLKYSLRFFKDIILKGLQV